MKLEVMIKEVNIKTLVSGDKAGRIVLETVNPDDVNKISKLSDKVLVTVIFDIEDKKS